MNPKEHSSENKKIEGLRYEKKKKSFLGKYREILLSAVIIAVVGMAAYFYLQQMNERDKFTLMQNHNEDLEQQLIVRDSLINDWVDLFDQVQIDLQKIKEKENMLTISSNDMELTTSEREAILADIQMLTTLLEENKRKIASLNARLRKSGAHIASLENKIQELNMLIEDRNSSIDSLTEALFERDTRLAEMNSQINKMETEIGEKSAIIDIQETELNKAFVAFGTSKELREKGIIVREGGFLGLGKTKMLNTNVPQEEFTMIDITTTTAIPVNAEKAELITEHPQDSYELIPAEEKDMVAYIEIRNPEEFWKVSRYAIVETDR